MLLSQRWTLFQTLVFDNDTGTDQLKQPKEIPLAKNNVQAIVVPWFRESAVHACIIRAVHACVICCKKDLRREIQSLHAQKQLGSSGWHTTRVTRWVCEKVAQKYSPTNFLFNGIVEKSSQEFALLLQFSVDWPKKEMALYAKISQSGHPADYSTLFNGGCVATVAELCCGHVFFCRQCRTVDEATVSHSLLAKYQAPKWKTVSNHKCRRPLLPISPVLIFFAKASKLEMQKIVNGQMISILIENICLAFKPNSIKFLSRYMPRYQRPVLRGCSKFECSLT
jgi:hypothetical protein